jgi:hypothetical protein
MVDSQGSMDAGRGRPFYGFILLCFGVAAKRCKEGDNGDKQMGMVAMHF